MRLNNRGDTIVEVLIALAVLGSVLVGGYSIATRSINSVRVSQERGEALKVAEGQIEQLRSRLGGVSDLSKLEAGSGFDQVFIRNNRFLAPDTFIQAPDNNVNAFCFNINPGPTNDIVVRFVGNAANPDDRQTYANGITRSCLKDGLYRVSIIPQYSASDNALAMTYTVTVRWDRAGGGAEESLRLSYRTVVGGVSVVRN